MKTCSLIIALCSCVASAQADNWPTWRGPQLDGTSSGVYPAVWSETKNVAWKVKLDGKSGSTPIVWGDRIFLTGAKDGKNTVTCLNRQGKQLWEQPLGDEVPGKHRKGSGSNPSPVTDGEHVFAYFKSGDFAALDLSGKVVWHQNLQKEYGEDTLWWDLGTSPILTSQHVVVTCMQSLPSPSYLAAYDKSTGKEIWRVERETGAPEEAAQSYSTPVVVHHEGQEQIVVLGADFVTCHTASDGKELWRVGTLNPDGEKYFRSIASPVVTGDIVIAPYARGKTLTAIRLGGKGDVTKSQVLWTKNVSSDVPTPAAVDGLVYVCTDKGTLACLNAETGEELWTEQTEKNRNAFSASPIVTDQSIYLLREDATTYVVQRDKHEIVAENKLHEGAFAVSTPVCVDNMILIRTFETLYCIQAEGTKVSQLSGE